MSPKDPEIETIIDAIEDTFPKSFVFGPSQANKIRFIITIFRADIINKYKSDLIKAAQNKEMDKYR